MTDRRSFIRMAIMGTAGVIVAGCDKISQSDWGPKVLNKAQGLNRRVQALLAPSSAMAKEYTEADLSPVFRSNGTAMPTTDAYQTLLANGFRDYRLQVGGLVDRPLSFSIDDLKQIEQVAQITRHDCVEGWSAIGKWHGVRLSHVLDKVGVKSNARYVVFHCYDEMDPGEPYYESVDIPEARHPQTLLAWGLNNQPLPIKNGAPLRLRVSRQLGYKQAKYIARIELVDSFAHIAGGKGGYWEDYGYEWYAGI
ncbi:molybdopterin-binding protein [Dyella sp.]|jgi:DMSO/TMAO reductase YedYZ molybdopterin-dependent catalytic subunit|uniref:molybdopterin-binding protein n=1 Tax=Dyella sp. TaxID=1869338 RepID=UPI002D79D217|nr:molybdopterin-binding protein [Dyella sp.]HET6433664.1 molybdopterin-binding protein [Dyella sp.]